MRCADAHRLSFLLLPFAFLLLTSDFGRRLKSAAVFVEGDPGGDLVREARPAFGRVREGLRGAGAEAARRLVPRAPLDLYVGVLEAHDVEGVRLAAHAVRGGRARLHVER